MTDVIRNTNDIYWIVNEKFDFNLQIKTKHFCYFHTNSYVLIRYAYPDLNLTNRREGRQRVKYIQK